MRKHTHGVKEVHTMELTKREKEIIIAALSTGIANGNTLNPVAFIPSNGKEYREIASLIRKLEYGA